MNHRTMKSQHQLDYHNNTTYSSIDCQYVMDHYNQIYDNIEQDVDHLNTTRCWINEKINQIDITYSENIDMLHRHNQ